MIQFVKGEDKELRNWHIEWLNRHKLNHMEYDKSEAYYLDVYRILKLINEENDALVLAAFSFDLESDFTEYALQDMIHDLGLVDCFESYEDWCENSVDSSKFSLKSVLNFKGLDSHGSDEELLLRINENKIPLEDWLDDFAHLSDDGKQLLDDLFWVKFYDEYLDCFDFNDFYHFIHNNSGNLEESALEFLDEHLILAEDADDFEYIDHCKTAKKLILSDSQNHGDLKKSDSEVMAKLNGYVDNLYNLKAEEDLEKIKRKKELLKNASPPMTEIDFCKMADNKYRLVSRSNDSYVMPVDLNRFKLYKLVGQCNDADFALYDLSFVPWCFRQQLRDLSFNEGFLTHNACEANWDDFSKDLKLWQLKDFLEKHNVDSKGNKKQLVRKIRENNLPLEEFESEKTFLTQESYDYLEEYSWIQFYMDHLYHFDFLDFFDYLDDHDGSIEEVSLSYLEEHIRLAEDSLDFDYIMRTYEAKTRILHLLGNLNDALTYDMRILHLNMNPLCLENYKFPSHIPLVPENISNLKELKSEFGDEVILNSFNKNWNFMGFESSIIPKDDVWKYLNTALNSKYQNHGSRGIREKYFMSLK